MVVGIDPDLVRCGVGVVANGRLTELHALHLFDLMRFIDEYQAAGAEFVLEDVDAIKPTFPRNVNLKVRDNISQKVGKVKATAIFISQYLERSGASYQMVRPLGGTAKAAKRNVELFQRLTGWSGQSNEDKRDAAMLALYGTRGRRVGDSQGGLSHRGT